MRKKKGGREVTDSNAGATSIEVKEQKRGEKMQN